MEKKQKPDLILAYSIIKMYVECMWNCMKPFQWQNHKITIIHFTCWHLEFPKLMAKSFADIAANEVEGNSQQY